MSQTTNSKQMEVFIEMMEKYPDVANGFTRRSREEVANLWKQLSDKVNCAGPPMKSVFEWKKVWADKKKYIKKKLAENLRMKNATGGGPYKAYNLSATEEAVVRICQFNKSVHGNADTRRFGLPACKSAGEEAACSSKTIDIIATSATEDEDPIMEDFCDDSGNGDLDEFARSHGSRKRGRQTHEPNAIQKQLINELKTVMDDLVTSSKRTYRAVENLAEQRMLTLQETKRHNLEMEKIRKNEVERKIDLKQQLIEIEKQKMVQKMVQMQMHFRAD